MKNFSKEILFSAAISVASLANAATPFTFSGDEIATIFASDLIWKKVWGTVNSLKLKGHDVATRTSTYTIETTEYVQPTQDAPFEPVSCQLNVSVQEKVIGPNPSEHAGLSVTNVDFSRCPTAQ